MNKVRKILTSKAFIITLLFTVVTFLGLIGYKWVVRKDTISSIAYNKFKNKDDYTVYVKEDGKYIPFLVIDNGYVSGSTLLLRESVLDEFRRMNDYSSYYKNSEIDRFLNSEYYNSLKEIHYVIKSTSVEITKEEAVGFSYDETEYIDRYVFLLSRKELDYDFENEGKKLDYFYKTKNRISHYYGVPMSWLLRTPAIGYFSAVLAVTDDGGVSIGNSFSLYGIRPAFCVDSSAKIKKKEGVIDGKEVYVLE